MTLDAFVTAFVTVFIAELGDKTQLATFGLAASQSQKWAVFAGASLALAVLFGEAVSRYVSPQWMQRVAGAVFLILGAFYLVGSFREAR